MSVAIIGGMDRLERDYINEAKKFGVELKVYKGRENNIPSRLNVDAVIIFTNKVSHKARVNAMKAARKNDIPVYLFHSCGICTLRTCLNCIKKI